ncbi:MAG: tetratricopeptide repeat protein [Gammaproteobacteria bacterium]
MISKALWLALFFISSAGALAHSHHSHAPATASTIDPVDRLVDLAHRAQSRHDFDHALALLDKALAQRPVNDNAWLLAASIHLVKGDAPSARHACQRLRQVPALVSITCRAQVAIAMGDADRASRQLTAVLENAKSSAARDDWLAWAYSVAGDAMRDRDDAQSKRHYRQSLMLSDNPQVRAALADVLLNNDQTNEALRVLAGHADVSLALQVRQLIAQRGLGQMTPTVAAQLHKQFQRWIKERNWEHVREMARFYLDVQPDIEQARTLATINIGIQREREDQRLVERTRAQREEFAAVR